MSSTWLFAVCLICSCSQTLQFTSLVKPLIDIDSRPLGYINRHPPHPIRVHPLSMQHEVSDGQVGATRGKNSRKQRAAKSSQVFEKGAAMNPHETKVVATPQSKGVIADFRRRRARSKWHGREPFPEPFVKQARGEHTATIIFLHGFGAQGAGRGEFLADKLNLPWCKIISPIAPKRGLQFGQVIQSWASIDGLLRGQLAELLRRGPSPSQITSVVHSLRMRLGEWVEEGGEGDVSELFKAITHQGLANIEGDEVDVGRNINHLLRLLHAEINAGIPPERIILVGFSQGGCVALECALQLGMQLGGIIALSTWFPQSRGAALEGHVTHRRDRNVTAHVPPLMVCHGDADWVVPYAHGKEVAERCSRLGLPSTFNTYKGMGHDISEAVVKDIRAFVAARAPRAAGRTLRAPARARRRGDTQQNLSGSWSAS